MASRNSYVYRLLKVLRQAGTPLSVGAILNYLRQQNAYRTEYDWRFRRGSVPDEAHVEEYLYALAEIGVVRATSNREGEWLWTLAADQPDQDSEVNREGVGGGKGDGGGGRGGGGGPGGNLPDGAGGDGLSEVLAHPVLFCLDEEHQDQLLRAALGILPSGLSDNSGDAV